MWTAIKKQFRVQWEEWLWMTVIILGGSLFGILLHYFIFRMDSTVNSYFPMGTLMGGIIALIIGAIMFMTQFCIYFNIEVSMGCTRSCFFVSYYVVGFVFQVYYVGVLIVINYLENSLDSILYPGLRTEVDFLPYLLKWGIPAAAGIIMIGSFCGALLLRYGRKAFWVMWAVWMVCCVGLPQLTSAVEEAPGSLFGRIGNAVFGMLRSIPGNFVIGALSVLCLFCLAASWLFLRRQQVTS